MEPNEIPAAEDFAKLSVDAALAALLEMIRVLASKPATTPDDYEIVKIKVNDLVKHIYGG